jgi:cytochrome c556
LADQSVSGAWRRVVLCATLCTLLVSVAWAAGAMEQTITNRQSNLKDLGGAFKTVRDQLKRSTPNIAEIKQAAQQISDLAADQRHWFPQGSGPEAGIKTAAKPEIWSDASGFAAALDRFSSEAPKLLQLASANDLDGLKAQAKVVGDTCKGCHDKYRVPDDT